MPAGLTLVAGEGGPRRPVENTAIPADGEDHRLLFASASALRRFPQVEAIFGACFLLLPRHPLLFSRHNNSKCSVASG
ncbi:hypothetical protein CEXT_379091 [Caerostris extrusa]|uniref:Uncharacterized protein n=1 Tax=Caerostris extrusa TaxID=172846 RepID=A0AAV4P2Y3_CAEEX|nr:hypothetical protein CEXT_379091 [Caerostris extrusa]